jgi:hypothetical protein
MNGCLLRFGTTVKQCASAGWPAAAAEAEEALGGLVCARGGHEDLARYGSPDVIVAFIDRRLGG